MIPLGISFSSSALVGSYLGELKIGLAKRFAFFTLVIGVLMTSVVAILIFFCPR
jgi:Na+-driven multidrug efflux pump